MAPQIRKIVTHIEETRIEGGKAAAVPQKMIGVAAVIANPWAGRGFVEDLKSDILRLAPPLGDIMVPLVLQAAGGPEAIEAFGKAAVVGTSGEIEHASGFIHTLRFGNKYRDAVGGTSYLSFSNIRGGAGCSIQVPLMHKIDPGFRSHYLTLAFSIVDAPAPDEIVVVLGASTTGRPHHRIGNRYSDMEEMKAEQGGS